MEVQMKEDWLYGDGIQYTSLHTSVQVWKCTTKNNN